jgi:ADP-dependent NAD(P)H-hydrate dehydratase / NAD(P)H-hydrate epimerase
MKIYTSEQMQEIDRKAIEELHVPSLFLMENAAKSVVKVILETIPLPFLKRGIVFASGKGNNGGDGIAAARILRNLGFSPKVFVFAKKEELSSDSMIQAERYAHYGEIVFSPDESGLEIFENELGRCSLIVDALLGTGTRGSVSGMLEEVIRRINSSGALKLSIDIPSGLSGDSFKPEGASVMAARTVALGYPKLPLFTPECEPYVGILHVADIGLPVEAADPAEAGGEALDLEWASGFFAERRRTAHKGTQGHLLLIAGSSGKFGAAILAGRAALNAGVGLLTVATPAAFAPFITSALPEAMTLPLPSTEEGTVSSEALDDISSFLNNADAVAVGPGLTTDRQTSSFVRKLYEAVKLPMAADADAINAFENDEKLLGRHAGARVLTPHPGELGRIMKLSPGAVVDDRYAICAEKAKEWNLSLLVKGYRSFMASGDGRWRINLSGGPHMAAPGVGDVLTGIIGALLARGLDPFDAMSLGVFWHGAAADKAFENSGYGILASDISRNLPLIEAEGRNSCR